MADEAGQAVSGAPRQTAAAGRAGGAAGRRDGALGPRLVLPVLAGLALLLSRVFPATAAPALWVSPSKRFLQLPCPGCGLTRAFCAIGHGDFAAAWAFNPFGYVFYGGALVVLVWPLLAWWRPRWADVLLRARGVTIAVLLLLGALGVFGLARILCLQLRSAGG